jgi:hypothetical protein
MLYCYGHREINRAKTIEELWNLMDNEVSRFFEQYEQHKQFDRRLIGESKVKDKQYEKEKSSSYPASQNKTSTAASKPIVNNNYKKVDNVNTTYPPKKRYSNMGEVIVEDMDVPDNTGNGSDCDGSLIREYFGQMVQSKGNDQRPKAYGKDKIRPKSDKDDVLPEICFRWFWETKCSGKDCPYSHPENVTQEEILGWKNFYRRLSNHRVKSAIDVLLPRLPEENMPKRFSKIEPEDTGIPMPDQVDKNFTSSSVSD